MDRCALQQLSAELIPLPLLTMTRRSIQRKDEELYDFKSRTTKHVFPIEISIAYGWKEHGTRDDGLNEHWKFLKQYIKNTAEQLIKASKKRIDSPNSLQIRISRLRARHGTGVLKSIKKRIKKSDILIFDISGNNPNVLFELGYAMAVKGSHSENIFVLSSNSKDPSDLALIMRTEYSLVKPASSSTNKKSRLKKQTGIFATFKDERGFRSALMDSLKDIAKERSMWGASMTTLEDELLNP
jgi:hypothetical protein